MVEMKTRIYSGGINIHKILCLLLLLSVYISTSISPHSSWQSIPKVFHAFSVRFNPGDWLGHAGLLAYFCCLFGVAVLPVFSPDSVSSLRRLNSPLICLSTSLYLWFLWWWVMPQYHSHHTSLCVWYSWYHKHDPSFSNHDRLNYYQNVFVLPDQIILFQMSSSSSF